MSSSERQSRVILLVTESSPLGDLWDAAMRLRASDPGDLVALFFTDQRWMRAASLPFTLEFSRFTGQPREFTTQRATEISRAATEHVRTTIRRLAAEAKVVHEFVALSETDEPAFARHVGQGTNLVVTPQRLSTGSVCACFARLGCRIEVVGADDVAVPDEAEARDPAL